MVVVVECLELLNTLKCGDDEVELEAWGWNLGIR